VTVAAIADIHGNVHALDAVLADPRLQQADRIVVLGDVVAGTFPTESFDRLAALGGNDEGGLAPLLVTPPAPRTRARS
jgi:predicted phosphodiesterase